MFHVTHEGSLPKWGFNFYPLGDKGSFGFRFRTKYALKYFRYSKITGKFMFDLKRFGTYALPNSVKITEASSWCNDPKCKIC